MRSPWFTFLLVLFTAVIGGMATVRFSQGNLNSFFGVPPSKVGDRLYTFDPNQVHRIRLADRGGKGVRAECVFENGQWKILSPWKDRMDPRVADAILLFTLGTKVIDAIPPGKIETSQAGFDDGIIDVRVEDKNGEPLAKYRIRRKTAVKFYDEKEKTEESTVFVQPADKNRKDYMYACTGGNIQLVLKDGFRYLRDHHPFSINPLHLETVRIENSESSLLMKRAEDTEKSPWRIVSPQELRTDPTAVVTLLTDLFNLQAQKILSRSEVTLPPPEVGKGEIIAVKHFGENEETILQVYPPVPADAETVHATISSRPDAVFELIRKQPSGPGGKGAADDGVIALSNLPDTVNELRNQTLTSINGAQLAGILISPSTGEPIALVRESPTSDFKVEIGGRQSTPNLAALQQLLVLITKAKVAGFPNDAATDLSPYGLDHPAISLRFVSFEKDDKDGFVLNFGQGHDGTWYGNRVGVSTVVKMDEDSISKIKIHPWDWRNTVLWSISSFDFTGFVRQIGDGTPLGMEWDFGSETWTAKEGPKDRSAEVDKARANHLLDTLVNLRVAEWLAPDDEDAYKALQTPLMTIDVVVKTVDAEGQRSGIVTRKLEVAPSTNALYARRKFYGRLDGEASPFLLDQADVRNLAANVFGD